MHPSRQVVLPVAFLQKINWKFWIKNISLKTWNIKRNYQGAPRQAAGLTSCLSASAPAASQQCQRWLSLSCFLVLPVWIAWKMKVSSLFKSKSIAEHFVQLSKDYHQIMIKSFLWHLLRVESSPRSSSSTTWATESALSADTGCLPLAPPQQSATRGGSGLLTYHPALTTESSRPKNANCDKKKKKNCWL